jgi:hypothetical protein
MRKALVRLTGPPVLLWGLSVVAVCGLAGEDFYLGGGLRCGEVVSVLSRPRDIRKMRRLQDIAASAGFEQSPGARDAAKVKLIV